MAVAGEQMQPSLCLQFIAGALLPSVEKAKQWWFLPSSPAWRTETVSEASKGGDVITPVLLITQKQRLTFSACDSLCPCTDTASDSMAELDVIILSSLGH